MPCRSNKRLELTTTTDTETAEALWHAYQREFEPLGTLALLSHVYDRETFLRLVGDERVWKVIGRRDGEPRGLGLVTNELDLVPQISPPFLRARYPELARRDAIYFGVLTFVVEQERRSTMFGRIAAGMGQVAAAAGGVIVFDVSRYNVEQGLADVLGRVAGWFPRSSFREIDSQHYFAAELPDPCVRSVAVEPVIDLRERSNAASTEAVDR